MQGRVSRHPVAAALLLASALGLLVALLLPADTRGKDRRADFRPDVHLLDSQRGGNLKTEDGSRVGRIKLIDIFVAPSEDRFRNREGGDRKRIYRVKAALSVLPDNPDFKVAHARCAMGTAGASFALTNPKGRRLFFPRDRSNLETIALQNEFTAGAFGLSIKIPFPGITYHVEQTSIAVESNALSSRRHKWSWETGDPPPASETFGFAGHWAAPAQRIDVFFLCKAVVINPDDLFNESGYASAKLKLQRELSP